MQSTERKHFFSPNHFIKVFTGSLCSHLAKPVSCSVVRIPEQKIAYQYCELTLSFLKYSNTTKKKNPGSKDVIQEAQAEFNHCKNFLCLCHTI